MRVPLTAVVGELMRALDDPPLQASLVLSLDLLLCPLLPYPLLPLAAFSFGQAQTTLLPHYAATTPLYLGS